MLWMPARMASSSAEEEVGAGGMGGGGVEEVREGAMKEEVEEDGPLCMAGSDSGHEGRTVIGWGARESLSRVGR